MVFSDEQLMLLFGRGRREAFDELYHRYATKLFRYLSKMLARSNLDVEDLVQEVFVRVSNAAPNYKATAKFSTWLYRIATNTCLSQLDSQKRRPHLRVIEGGKERTATYGYPLKSLEQTEGEIALEKAVSTLSDEQRAVFVLRQVEQLSYEEISESLHMPIGTVKTNLHRARKQLVNNLQSLLTNQNSLRGEQR